MKRTIAGAFLWLALIAAAFAQQPLFPQTLPGSTVIGRLGIVAGPVEAIPFSILLAQIKAVPTSRSINTTAPLVGGGNLGTDLTISLGTQSANRVLAGPTTGSAAAPSFRALVAADLAASAASHAVPVDVGGTPTWKVLPDCQDASGHLNYTQSTDAFSCGTGGGGNVTGPGSSISGDIALFSGSGGTTIQDAGGGIPSIPVLHPSSSNLVGAGCATPHQAWWVDQNLCSSADNWILNSTDPSALIFPITIGGSKTTGDVVTLTFTFSLGAVNCSVGCNVAYTVQSGDTLATITTGLMNAIKANASLYNNVAGAQGLVLNLANTTTTTFSMDWNLNAGTFKLTSSVSGSATETVSIPSACSTQCPTAFDVNPTIITGRLVSGLAPPNGSQLATWIVQSNSTGSPNAYSVQYGLIGLVVANGTTGSLDADWTIGTTGAAGAVSRAFYVGKHFGDVQDAAPTLTGTCGTGAAIASGSTDTDGQVTLGTGTPTACTIVFAHSYLSTPRCMVARQSGAAGLAFNATVNQINTGSGAANDVVNWHCAGR
jgi:hypothetical protein